MASTALVLGGGGITGAAWEVGLIAGLAARGTDLTAADLVLGTSAGALAGAQVTSGLPLAELDQAHFPGRAGDTAAAQHQCRACHARAPYRRTPPGAVICPA